MKYAKVDTTGLIFEINTFQMLFYSKIIPCLQKQKIYPILGNPNNPYIEVGEQTIDLLSDWGNRYITVLDQCPSLIEYETVLAKLP